MKNKIIILGILLILINGITAATYWVTDPSTSCPQTYNSISCGADQVCGITGSDTPYCYDTTSFNSPPTTKISQAGDTYQSNLLGGFIGNCYGTDASSPYCDNSANFWCNRNNTCYSTLKRTTNCTGGSWGSSICNYCRTNYFQCDGGGITSSCEWHATDYCSDNTGTIQNNQCFSSSFANCTRRYDYLDCDDDDNDGNELTCNSGDAGNGCEINPGTTTNNTHNHYTSCTTYACDTNYLDCDGNGYGNDTSNGCEILDGGSCAVGELAGTYDGCDGVVGNCVISSIEYGTSGVLYQWSSSTLPLLWFKMFGSAPVVNFTSSNDKSFIINNSGVFWDNVILGSGTNTQKTTNNFYLYNDSTIIYFNETQLNATIDNKVGGDNSSWNETHADTLYSDIQWNYNQSTATFNMWNSTWDNSYMNVWNYNQSTATFNMYNITWSSTYNSTYNAKTTFPGWTNVAFKNKTNIFTENQNFTGNISLSNTKFICLNSTCGQWIMANSSGVYIQA